MESYWLFLGNLQGRGKQLSSEMASKFENSASIRKWRSTEFEKGASARKYRLNSKMVVNRVRKKRHSSKIGFKFENSASVRKWRSTEFEKGASIRKYRLSLKRGPSSKSLFYEIWPYRPNITQAALYVCFSDKINLNFSHFQPDYAFSEHTSFQSNMSTESATIN